MNPLALIPLTSGIALGFLGVFVVAANRPLDSATRIYVALCAATALYAFAEFHLQVTGTSPEVADLWLRVRGIWPLPTVLLLHFIEDFSLEEIAGITGAPLGTVKSRLHYAKSALRELLEGQSS